MSKVCLGRECKLGWGYNESLRRLIPVEGDPPNVKSEAYSSLEYFVYSLSSNTITHWPWISFFLEPSYKKFLDFEIIFDNNQYWLVLFSISRRKEESEKLSEYSLNCGHFVKQVEYGLDLRIHFPKMGFPENKDEVETSFKGRNFNETQKKTKCRILINYKEIREMTLGELIDFMKELDERKHSQYDIPVIFHFEKLDQKNRETVISNEQQFRYFLSYLHCVYRKIEMKMEKAEYPEILPDLDSEEKSFVKICVNLDKAKEDYKSVDKKDFLKMYPVLKKLFFCYTDYIRYSINHLDVIDEGDHLPGTFDEILPWLQQLNTWFPIQINKKWVNCTGYFIGIPTGYQHVVTTLHGTTKFKDSQVINDTEADESYIGEENDRKILFGFVNMDEAEKAEIPDDSTVFKSECPDECSKDSRKWICTKCGDFVKTKLDSVGHQLLYCSCGSKRYREKLLTCHHPSHREQKSDTNINESEIIHPPVPESKEIQDQILSYDKIRNEESTDPKILNAIIYLSNNESEEKIKSALKKLQDTDLDGDTQNLINRYLN